MSGDVTGLVYDKQNQTAVESLLDSVTQLVEDSGRQDLVENALAVQNITADLDELQRTVDLLGNTTGRSPAHHFVTPVIISYMYFGALHARGVGCLANCECRI